MERRVAPRIILIIVALVALGIATFFVINRYGGGEVYTQEETVQSPLAVVALDRESLSQDPDGDGLENWQEVLWNTDKNNPDTDGDGTYDGEEVAQKRNPTVADENDSLLLTTDADEDTTVTEQFSRDLLAQFLLAKDAGVTVNSEVSKALVNQTLQGEYISIPVEQYTVADLSISSSADVATYADTVGLLLIGTSGKAGDVSEVEILETYTTTQDPSILTQLSGPLERYTNLRDALRNTNVPEELVLVHLSILNGIEAVRSGLVGVQEFENDAVLGVASLSLYAQGSALIRDAITLASAFYEQNNITFEENTAGYIFLNGI